MKEMMFNGFLILTLVALLFVMILSIISNNYKKKKLMQLKEKTLRILREEKETLKEKLIITEEYLNQFLMMDLPKNEDDYKIHLNDLKSTIRSIERRIVKINNKILESNEKELSEIEMFNIIKEHCLNYDHKVKKINCYNNISDFSNLFTRFSDIVKIQKKILFKKKLELLRLKFFSFLKGVY